MKPLYPEIENYQSHTLSSNADHQVYFEESGNPEGLPVIFLHGGPGSGCNENHRRYFNPEKYRIIIFDQRGCNRSGPQGTVKDNTTQYLLMDIEAIRKQLKINRWLIFGGSWGATLGLLYAQAFPKCVSGMVLRGTFLAREQDLKWFAQEGANRIFPEYWAKFVEGIPEAERSDLVDAYYRRVHEGDKETCERFARAWSEWASKVVTWTLREVEEEPEDIQKLVNQVRIESHYAKHHYFIKENQILNNIDKLPDVPIIIIHGRYDLTCPLISSWSLHEVLPRSELIIVPDAGHLAGEPPMIDALITATDRMAELLS